MYVKDYKHPIEATVSLDEYIGLTKDGKVNAQWSRKPGTMIRKVALTQALREAFPEDLGGMYEASEVGVDFDETGSPTIIPAEPPVTGEAPENEPFDAPEPPPVEELEQF